jgi:chemotaxis protein methyltransferase CheR
VSAIIPHNVLPGAIMLKEEEIDLLLVDLLELYDYDFNYYSRESLKRRISKIFRLEKFDSFEAFRKRIQTDDTYIEHLVDRITVNVTEMFRDVDFFREMRNVIIPQFKNLAQIRIWHAGCSTGEEVFSMAILLHEAGLLDKTQFIGTDINPLVIEKARRGTYPLSLIQLYERNYAMSGGEMDFASYYTSNTNGGTFKRFLSEKVTFSAHNLASDIYINTFDLVVCRNVVIYFDKELRDRVFNLFDLSLQSKAFLALGEKETIKSSSISEKYTQESKEKIWKKIL